MPEVKFEIDDESLKRGFREVLMAQFSPEKQAAMIEAAIEHVLNGKSKYMDESVMERIIRQETEEQIRQIVKEHFESKKEEVSLTVLQVVNKVQHKRLGNKLLETIVLILAEEAHY